MFQEFFPSYFEWWHVPLVFMAGLIGESFGALVGGGSIITMPALLLTGAPIQTAIAVDNAAAIGTEIGILSATWRKAKAHKKLTLFMAIPLTLGGVGGTWLLLHVSPVIIKYLMAATIIIILIHSYIAKKRVNKIGHSHYAALFVFLLIIGIYSNFMAAGEGAFSRMGIMALLGMSFLQVQGIKATATVPSRLYSLIITAFAGLIIWPYLIAMWASGFIAGRYSTKFAKKLPDKLIRIVLTIMSILFVIYLLVFY